ncbi:MAG: hypothetical protein ACHQ50_01695 [Fimbriimonadales bacterium]
MKSRKRLWIAVGSLCALAILVGWLARPEDEFRTLRSLHPIGERSYPNEALDATDWIFSFKATPGLVMARLPLPPHAKPADYIGWNQKIYEFPSGNTFVFDIDGGLDRIGPPLTCEVGLREFHRKRAWYQRAWSTIKNRLGL